MRKLGRKETLVDYLKTTSEMIRLDVKRRKKRPRARGARRGARGPVAAGLVRGKAPKPFELRETVASGDRGGFYTDPRHYKPGSFAGWAAAR